MFSNARRIRRILLVGVAISSALASASTIAAYRHLTAPLTHREVVEAYFEHLDFRRFRNAHALLDPAFRPPVDEMLFRWKWQGGLVNSYGKLESIGLAVIAQTDTLVDYEARLVYLTSVARIERKRQLRLVRRGNNWFILPTELQLVQTPVRLQRQQAVTWNNVGRRQPRAEADLYRDRLDRPRVATSEVKVVLHKGRYAIIGQVTNADHDPAAVSVFGELLSDDTTLARRAAGKWGAHRLLPAESAGMRVDFDGVLSLEDAIAEARFDPEEFLPPTFERAADAGRLDARALVGVKNIYRGITLNNLQFSQFGGKLILSGVAANVGTETATVTRINVLLYDDQRQPRWVDAGFVENNVYPGQSVPFAISLPQATDVEVIANIPAGTIQINGASQQADLGVPGAEHGTIPLGGTGGYSAARLHVTAMTHEPLF